jgi:translation initiation factor IF-2
MVYPGDTILTVDSVGEAKAISKSRQHEREQKEHVVLTEAPTVTAEDAREFASRRGRHRVANQPKTVIKYRSKAIYKQQMLEDGTLSVEEGLRKVPIIVKSNTAGVLQVISDTVAQLEHEDLELSIVSAKTGHLNSGDVDFAETVKAPIFSFSVDIPQAVAKYAVERNVHIYKQRILYLLIDDVRDYMSSCLDPIETEIVLGKADILQRFELNNNRRGIENPVVAGCKVSCLCTTTDLYRVSVFPSFFFIPPLLTCIVSSFSVVLLYHPSLKVTSGEMDKKQKFRIVREDGENRKVILDHATASSLRHFKESVQSVTKGQECGVIFDSSSQEFETGDKIVCYKTELVKQKIKSVY